MTGPGPSDPAQQGPPPATPPPTPPAGEQWGQQGSTPEWAAKAQEWRPAPVAAGPTAGIAYADLGIRIGAYIIDIIILAIGVFLVNAILVGFAFFGGGFGGRFVYALIGGVINLAISAVYFVYTWTTMKASPGQRMLGLMTVSETDGSALTQNAAIMRWLLLSAPGILGLVFSQAMGYGNFLGLLVSLAGLGWTIYLLYTTANDPKRQGFHDKYVKSVVVKPSA
ncbi:MAG TPA: RDD family protein [Candidatus Limnocylindrales bacterium]|nr:RDD family protein [Candidatus Limnocylindrales bacterium]